MKVYPWNVLYSTLSYNSSLIQSNLKLDELAETVHDERSNILYVLIIGCVHGTFDKELTLSCNWLHLLQNKKTYVITEIVGRLTLPTKVTNEGVVNKSCCITLWVCELWFSSASSLQAGDMSTEARIQVVQILFGALR